MANRPVVRSAQRRSGIVYTPTHTAESIKKRQERASGRFDSPFKPSFDTYRPKDGDNRIRILQPTWEPRDHYGYSIFVHRFIGPDSSTYLCPRRMYNKKCPICEAERASKNAGEEDEAKALAAVEQLVCWVIDRKEDDDHPMPRIYALSWTQDRDLLELCHDRERGSVLNIDNPDIGFDVKITRTGKGVQTKYLFAIDREESPISDDPKHQEEILDYIPERPIPSTLKVYDFNYLANVLSGGGEEKDEDLDNSDPEVAAEETAADEEHEAQEAHQSMRRTTVAHSRTPDEPLRRVGRGRPEPEPEVEEAEVVEETPPRRAAATRSNGPQRVVRTRREESPPEDEESYSYDEETGEIAEEEPEPVRQQPRRTATPPAASTRPRGTIVRPRPR